MQQSVIAWIAQEKITFALIQMSHRSRNDDSLFCQSWEDIILGSYVTNATICLYSTTYLFRFGYNGEIRIYINNLLSYEIHQVAIQISKTYIIKELASSHWYLANLMDSKRFISIHMCQSHLSLWVFTVTQASPIGVCTKFLSSSDVK